MSYTITVEDELVRRISLIPHVDLDENGKAIRNGNGRPVLSSALFKYSPKNSNDGISVDIMQILLSQFTTRALALDHAVFNQTTRAGVAFFAAGIIIAGVPMGYNLPCDHDPIPGNYTHALIKTNISKSRARDLANACQIVEKSASGVLTTT